MFWTIPTLMTWTRIVAIPLIVGVFYAPLDPATRNLIATVMFVVFAATDWLDGYLARKLNQTSSFGAFLDPVADKFLVCASLLVLVHLQRADAVMDVLVDVTFMNLCPEQIGLDLVLDDGPDFSVELRVSHGQRNAGANDAVTAAAP